jgi:hypothetical protein
MFDRQMLHESCSGVIAADVDYERTKDGSAGTKAVLPPALHCALANACIIKLGGVDCS